MGYTDFEKEMMKRCPNLYRIMHCEMLNGWEPIQEFGFEINKGWHPLLKELSIKLESLIMQIPEPERHEYYVSQVKQKYGSLLYYMEKSNLEMSQLINTAEHQADQTCEFCGKMGKLRSTFWIRVLCDKHYDDFK